MYDEVYRLKGVDYSDGSKESFTYDAVGNRIKKVLDGINTNYTYNSFNQLTKNTEGDVITEYKYTKHGDLKQKIVNKTVTEQKGKKTVTKKVSTKTNFVYNFEYDLTHINKQGGSNCSFSYDANGRRIGRSIAGGETVKYVYDGLNIVADLNSNNSIKNIYNTELQLDQMLSCKIDGVKEYYHTDHLGSIRKMTDGSRALKASYTYEAFGKKKTSPSNDKNRYAFSGREDEAEFGLMYYRARYYDPDTGRFISPDPFTRGPDDPRISYRNNWYSAIHGEATLYGEWLNPHSFNRYLYCNNNPVGNVDPLGLSMTARVAGSLAWLPFVDSPFLPFADIAYGVIVGVTAVCEYGPLFMTIADKIPGAVEEGKYLAEKYKNNNKPDLKKRQKIKDKVNKSKTKEQAKPADKPDGNLPKDKPWEDPTNPDNDKYIKPLGRAIKKVLEHVDNNK